MGLPWDFAGIGTKVSLASVESGSGVTSWRSGSFSVPLKALRNSPRWEGRLNKNWLVTFLNEATRKENLIVAGHPMFTFGTGLGMFLGASFYGAVAGGVALGAILGGVTAFGSVKIAQNALASGEIGPDALETGPERLLPDPEEEAV
jgi:hypothetical protein